MTGEGGRAATWRERENNKRRERRRRAISAKIFAGLRAASHGGNNALPGSRGDNNELLKALCRQAGWTVLDDGTTFRTTTTTTTNGREPLPPREQTAAAAAASPSTTMSPYSSSSSFPSPTRRENPNPNPSSIMNPSYPLPLRISTSAPATSPLSSPTAARPAKLQRIDWDSAAFLHGGGGPRRAVDFGLWGGAPSTAPASPTFNLVRTAPAAAAGVGELERREDRVVKPWEGETIHEGGVDELELTLGVGRNASVLGGLNGEILSSDWPHH